MTPSRPLRIALLFNHRKGYDRDVIAGVAEHIRERHLHWDVMLAPDCKGGPEVAARFEADGVIANADDGTPAAELAACPVPLVSVGASCADPAGYPKGVPYVASDNPRMIALAHEHLIAAGLSNFALYSLPPAPHRRWAGEREQAFVVRMRADDAPAHIFRGRAADDSERESDMGQLQAWVASLPRPVGIIAVTDHRARQLVHACSAAGLSVPGDVAVVGIDNDPLERMLAPVPISSVIQGAEEMGRNAALLLERALRGDAVGAARVLVAPTGINVLASCGYPSGQHPHVTRARHFIRHHARRGIKSEQVADHVGVCRSSLDALFRRELGRSVHEELLGFKLEQAKHYLASGQWKIADVARACGFTSVHYLYAVFARELGCTPRQYQQRSTA